MKFTLAWAKIAAQNVTLKIATVTLAAVAAIQLITITQLALRDAVVIERGCLSRAANQAPAQNTPEEIKTFLLEALPARFDSVAPEKDEMLSVQERATRAKEQTALNQRQMRQKIVVQEIEVSDKGALVQADRLITFGKVRTALPFPLKAIVQTTRRSDANPYGLVLVETSAIEEPKEQK